MTGVTIPPPNEPFVEAETGKVNEVWYRYLNQTVTALNSATSAAAAAAAAASSAASVAGAASTATTFAQTILATTTSAQVRTILDVDQATSYGSWTPGLLVGTTAVNSYALQVGRYARRGRMVHAWGTVTVSSLTGTTGTISISGLPVKASSTTPGVRFAGGIANSTGMTGVGSTFGGMYCSVTTGSSIIAMLRMSVATSGLTPLNSSFLTTTASLSVSVTYESTV